ncbi:M35 family metallo-endopeptidase [Blastopirellula marina]|nr:M35 family metallo-endopeptidase [Blastopirellula marina]
MGFELTGFSAEQEKALRELEAEILSVLDDAAARLQAGDVNSDRFFGQSDNLWITQVKTKLRRCAALFRAHDFFIEFEETSKMSPSGFAAADRPKSGWHDRTRNSIGSLSSGKKSFYLKLDFAYVMAPVYRTAANSDSKFQTLVHELTHQMLDTHDFAYGLAKCETLAMKNRKQAQQNADNWGYFVEAFRCVGPAHPGTPYGGPAVPPKKAAPKGPPTPPPKFRPLPPLPIKVSSKPAPPPKVSSKPVPPPKVSSKPAPPKVSSKPRGFGP